MRPSSPPPRRGRPAASSCSRISIGGREARIADLHDEVELPPPGVEEGLLGRDQLRWRVQGPEGIQDVLIEAGALVEEDRDDRLAILPRRRLLEPDPEVAAEPSLLDVGRLAHPLELGEVVAGGRAGIGVPAAARRPRAAARRAGRGDPHVWQRASEAAGTATAQGAAAPSRNMSYAATRAPRGPGVARAGRARPLTTRADRAAELGSLGRHACSSWSPRRSGPCWSARCSGCGAESIADPGLRSRRRTRERDGHSRRRALTILPGRHRRTSITRIARSRKATEIVSRIPKVWTLRQRRNSIASRGPGGGWPRSPRIRSLRVSGTSTRHPPPGPAISTTCIGRP